MRKLSIMSLSFKGAFAAGTMDLFQFIDVCRTLNADGVDLNARSFPNDGDATIKAVKWRCIQHGLAIACLSIPNQFGLPATELPAEIERTKRWVERALLLGAPQVRVFAGVPNAVEPRAEVWKRCSEALHRVAEYGNDIGVRVSLQNHNHGALTETGGDVLRFLQEAGPHLSHVWDTGQYVGSPGASGANEGAGAQEVLYQSLQQTVNRATHVRCKFYRIDSGVEEWLDYPRIFGMLEAAHYNGFCSLVYEGPSEEHGAVTKAVAYLRTLLNRTPS